MSPASLNESLRMSKKRGLTRPQCGLAAIFLASTSLLGQVMTESAVLASQTTTAAVGSAGTSLPAPTAVPVQQRVLKYNLSHVAQEPASREERSAGESTPLTLRLLVGRSLFINTPQRLRLVYVSNPAVLDSLTASPYQLVITAKAAGTGSLVLWDERGQSVLYTVLADLDIGGLQDSLARALPVTTSRSAPSKVGFISRVWWVVMVPSTRR